MPIPFVLAAMAAISAAKGISQKGKAKALAAQNKRPTYDIPQEVTQNRDLAKVMANSGLPKEQYNQQVRNIDRNANNTLARAMDRRGGLGSVGAVQQMSNDASLNLNVADSQQRMANIRNLMQQNSMLAQYRDKAFNYNQRAKYEENAAAVRALNAAGDANMNNAMQTGLSGIAGMGSNGGGFGGMGSGGGYGYGVDGYGMQGQGMQPMSPAQNQWLQMRNSFRGMNGYEWNTSGALPYNDRRIIPRY